jgi:hypothetical protein
MASDFTQHHGAGFLSIMEGEAVLGPTLAL